MTETGRFANPFPIGPALSWAPFFMVAHGAALVFEPAGAHEGTSYLHQSITLYGSFLYAFAAGIIAFVLARKRYGPAPALIGMLGALLGGPLLQYTLNQPAYAHAPSAFAIAALLAVWERGRNGRSQRGWLLLGALIGMAALTRAQNIVFALPAVVEGIAGVVRAVRRRAGISRAMRAPLLGALVAFALFSPQMLTWKIIYGHWLGIPQGPGYMRWLEPLWSETLFSSRNGLFPYAPLWALGMLGVIELGRRDRQLAFVLLGTFVLSAYVNGASSDWSGGGALGGRRYDGLVVHIALGLAALASALIDWCEARPRAVAGAGIALIVGAAGTCNYLMTDDYRRGRLAPSAAKDSLAYYDSVALRALRWVWQAGNPLSWPAAWTFAMRTGAPPARYDSVVGAFFLTDFRLEAYRKPANKLRDELRFGAPEHEKFLVFGFGPKDETGRIAGARARFLVPLNHGGGVGMVLSGTARTRGSLVILWNGTEAQRALLEEGPFEAPFELSSTEVKRGINVVELSAEGVSYEKLSMTERDY